MTGGPAGFLLSTPVFSSAHQMSPDIHGRFKAAVLINQRCNNIIIYIAQNNGGQHISGQVVTADVDGADGASRAEAGRMDQ